MLIHSRDQLRAMKPMRHDLFSAVVDQAKCHFRIRFAQADRERVESDHAFSSILQTVLAGQRRFRLQALAIR